MQPKPIWQLAPYTTIIVADGVTPLLPPPPSTHRLVISRISHQSADLAGTSIFFQDTFPTILQRDYTSFLGHASDSQLVIGPGLGLEALVAGFTTPIFVNIAYWTWIPGVPYPNGYQDFI